MKRQILVAIVAAAVGVLTNASVASAAGPPFELFVRKDHLLGSSSGTLSITQEAVEYKTSHVDDRRRWIYEDIKQVHVLSSTRISILTFEDQGRLRLGADRVFAFEVLRGEVTQDLVSFLLERIERPVVTAVMPQQSGDPLFRAPVKHERSGKGSDGNLLLYNDHLVYMSERGDQARYWRFGDIFAVLRLDRDRLQVMAYEGGGGKIRPFTFELKVDLPEGFYDALWARVNPPVLDLRKEAATRLTQVPPE